MESSDLFDRSSNDRKIAQRKKELLEEQEKKKEILECITTAMEENPDNNLEELIEWTAQQFETTVKQVKGYLFENLTKERSMEEIIEEKIKEQRPIKRTIFIERTTPRNPSFD